MLTEDAKKQLANLHAERLYTNCFHVYNRYTGQLEDIATETTMERCDDVKAQLYAKVLANEEKYIALRGPCLPIYCMTPSRPEISGKILGTVTKNGEHIWQIVEGEDAFYASPLKRSLEVLKADDMDTLRSNVASIMEHIYDE